MKKLLSVFFITGVIVFSQTNASEYGCTVLLCLGNPASNGGPKGIAECVSPINRLYDDLAHGRGFPSCDKEDGNDGRSYARQIYDPYDPCPAPLKAAPVKSFVVQGSRRSTGKNKFDTVGAPEISEVSLEYSVAGKRACVGEHVGSYVVGGYNGYVVNVYDKVLWQQSQNPRAIDVFIDNQWYQRVRW